MHQQMFEIDPSGAVWYEWAAVLVTNIGWTLAYILIIRKGFKDKQFGAPFIAIAIMWSYEFAYVFIWPVDDLGRKAFEVCWLVFDSILLVQVGMYARNSWRHKMVASRPVVFVAIGTGLALWGTVSFIQWVGLYDGVIPALIAMAMIAVLMPMLAIARHAQGFEEHDGISFWGNVLRSVADFSTAVITWVFFDFANDSQRPLRYLECDEQLIPELAVRCGDLDYALAPISPNNHYTLFLFFCTLACDALLLVYLGRKKAGRDVTYETYEMPTVRPDED